MKNNKYTLGLDIGTNSIGWVLFLDGEIIDGNVIIFPIGTNLIKGVLEETKNAQRRGYRGAARNHFRFKLRRKKLKEVLKELDMLPDFQLLDKPCSTQLYKLRADAIKNEIDKKEFGRILLLINKHRGFKTNSKTLTKSDDEDGAVSNGISQLKTFMINNDAKTIGEYFHKMYNKSNERYNKNNWHNIEEPFDERALNESGDFIIQNNRGIRRENGRYVSREMYENEFDLIWTEQKKHNPNLTGSKEEYDIIRKLPVDEKRKQKAIFKNTLYWKIRNQTIFYQRPLKSQKKYIGKCTFEKNKRTAPLSSLLYQEFRIWKQLSDLRYSDFESDILKQPLPKEWKEKVFNYLQTNRSLPLKILKNNTDIFDVLNIINKKNFEFIDSENEEGKVLNGNKTLFAIHSICGDKKYNELENKNQLEKLWHILYMAKDDEWLKDTLTWKWNFSNEIADELIVMGLEDGFANYSSKVLKKIIPFMQNGKDEHDALILASYLKSSDEVKDDIQLKQKIKSLRNNELRNPVVEKAVGETIRLVNALLKEYQIDQENFAIHIESTREFKKPKQQREDMRRANSDTDKQRIEYANFLNEKRNEGKLNFARQIQKNDSIIQKFELWLELGADKEDVQFNEFEKIVKRKEKEKHSLWLECNRVCPYTGKIISLTNLFSSDIEIEHIIPYSRSLDDSFMNKTITFSEVNKEKANRTAYEYIKSKGDEEFKKFKSRISVFNKDKREDKFLIEKVANDFSSNQLTNTSYIAKYVRNKLQEVCKDVQFTNGAATAELRRNDWKLGSLLDKVRYDEEFNTDIDKILMEFRLYKRDYLNYLKQKANSTDIPKVDWKNLTSEATANYESETKNPLYDTWLEIQKFDEFRGAKGKKDRSDHRHHLLDAIITALTTRSIIQKLSTLNAAREKKGFSMYDDYGNITREEIDLPIEIDKIKAALNNVLIYHKPEQKLLTSKTNRIKKRKTNKDDDSVIKQKTIAPRGSLVGDNFYGKLKSPRVQGFDKDTVYVKRVTLNGTNFPSISSLEKVVDKQVKVILKSRLELHKDKGEKAFSEEELVKNPVFMYSTKEFPNGLPEKPLSKKGKPLPVIKKVRVANKNTRNLIQLPAFEKDDKANEKTLVNKNRYAEADGNYIMALYESREINKKGKIKIKRDFEILSFYEAVNRRIKGEKLYADEKKQKDETYLPLMKSCPYLKKDDFVVMYEKDENEIDWKDSNNLKQRLYKTVGLSSEEKYGLISFIKHNVSSKNASYGKAEFKIGLNTFTNRHTQLKVIKVKINNLGKIIKYY